MFVAAWGADGGLAGVVGGVAAWTGRRGTLWLAALFLSALVVAGAMSIGLLFAPAAVCLLCAAVLSGWAGPLVADSSTPPTLRSTAWHALVGALAVGLGAWLVEVAVFDRDLFGSCASETPACVAATTNWPAVAATLAGLVAIAAGARSILRGGGGALALVRASMAT
ncbi:hypothetical protein [Halobaculum gomorrense]|uniref:Uncharacterized protein n=1 Tax=Halobaculum gomorrense TaxID=43928 RepID=A0A1M5T3X3_9EURY|nr:hypothetical protein [Halobaculum gomorrense]SHH45441.1 hypothetical protein SAMN05443636_2629 [Halobaculum gomorrense]